jgi:hypothetical protein
MEVIMRMRIFKRKRGTYVVPKNFWGTFDKSPKYKKLFGFLYSPVIGEYRVYQLNR